MLQIIGYLQSTLSELLSKDYHLNYLKPICKTKRTIEAHMETTHLTIVVARRYRSSPQLLPARRVSDNNRQWPEGSEQFWMVEQSTIQPTTARGGGDLDIYLSHYRNYRIYPTRPSDNSLDSGFMKEWITDDKLPNASFSDRNVIRILWCLLFPIKVVGCKPL